MKDKHHQAKQAKRADVCTDAPLIQHKPSQTISHAILSVVQAPSIDILTSSRSKERMANTTSASIGWNLEIKSWENAHLHQEERYTIGSHRDPDIQWTLAVLGVHYFITFLKKFNKCSTYLADLSLASRLKGKLTTWKSVYQTCGEDASLYWTWWSIAGALEITLSISSNDPSPHLVPVNTPQPSQRQTVKRARDVHEDPSRSVPSSTAIVERTLTILVRLLWSSSSRLWSARPFLIQSHPPLFITGADGSVYCLDARLMEREMKLTWRMTHSEQPTTRACSHFQWLSQSSDSVVDWSDIYVKDENSIGISVNAFRVAATGQPFTAVLGIINYTPVSPTTVSSPMMHSFLSRHQSHPQYSSNESKTPPPNSKKDIRFGSLFNQSVGYSSLQELGQYIRSVLQE
ncbi:hypothetical protein BLNAU_22585 [Blattamonas nauphoetae]|uniref:Uncharacterized protein n=1 Tax=Blattamonas nauphoetae TaxID=2049346 RepID=A0ABQ9WWW3_9EUKA|nr:hypothetical protein BLNAU_22585 [Blattamonas nauphoetae]